ncbi:hypothetical protein B0H21DRAFT_536720 [Amylocystis lapponica]|nr:hypothetical protein B0H21DRAFT_536720 [Amylocystis lapponica]
MPASTQYEVLLDFTNDTHDCASVQLLRDYGRNTDAIVLLHPGESVTLILDAGKSPSGTRADWTSDGRDRLRVQVRAQDALQGRQRDVSRQSMTFALGAHHACSQRKDVAGRQLRCIAAVSQRLAALAPASAADPWRPVQGITVDRLWRDMRFCMWNDS